LRAQSFVSRQKTVAVLASMLVRTAFIRLL
jgi:hypothetical protein